MTTEEDSPEMGAVAQQNVEKKDETEKPVKASDMKKSIVLPPDSSETVQKKHLVSRKDSRSSTHRSSLKGSGRKSGQKEVRVEETQVEESSQQKADEGRMSELNIDERESKFLQTMMSIMTIDFETMSDSDGSLSLTPSYVEQNELQEVPDFFENFAELLPEVDDISDDELQAIKKSLISVKHEEIEAEPPRDVGSFVDPLTGEVVLVEPEEEIEEEEELVEEESEESIELSEDSELLILLEREIEEPPPKILDDAEVFETLFELETRRTVKVEEEFDWEEFERQQQMRQLISETVDFLKELIDNVVDKCEYIDPLIILRQNLDKELLMSELDIKLSQLEMEQKVRAFVNRKVVDHFYRKGNLRVLLDGNPDELTKDINKYKEATTKLDQMMGREEIIRENTMNTIEQLRVDLTHAQSHSTDILQDLEDLIRKSIVRDKVGTLQKVVNDELAKMAAARNEISELRYLLIQRQHTYGELSEKMYELEDLGSGLRMRSYENLQTEAQALGKKIEERNAELNKLRIRCSSDLHILAHIQEKQHMLHDVNSIKMSALNELHVEKQLARERIFELKLSRTKIRKEIQELSFQCGLLDKPALMLDFDHTVHSVNQKRKNITEMRNHYEDLCKKIEYYENKY